MDVEFFEDRAEIEDESVNAIKNFINENKDNINLAIDLKKKEVFDLICISIKKEGKPLAIVGRRKAADSEKWWTGNFQAFIRITETAEIITEDPDFILGKTRNRWIEIGKIIYEPAELELCKYCNSVLYPGAVYCQNCGKTVE